jgi:hypothetical protein
MRFGCGVRIWAPADLVYSIAGGILPILIDFVSALKLWGDTNTS